MYGSFFKDEGSHNDVTIDIEIFSKTLSEYANSFEKKRMISKMKEIFRDQTLLLDFLQRLNVDLKYLIELTYAYSPKIITPQLRKELASRIDKNPIYPRE
jgi:hypothetical protein